jgi:hypothetical protein
MQFPDKSMVTLNRKDLSAAFILLAILFLFDSYPGGFLLAGGIVFIIMVGLVFLSDRQDNTIKLVGDQWTKNGELIFRISAVAVFLGVLLSNFFIVAIGFLLPMLFLFMPVDSFSINLRDMTFQAQTSAKAKQKGK